MKLERVRNLAPVRLVGRVPGELHETLTAYARYYREEHGEAIEVWPLVVQMLRVFLDDDRLFQMLAGSRDCADMTEGREARHVPDYVVGLIVVIRIELALVEQAPH